MNKGHVVVIGAGLGGLLAGIKLKEVGYSFTILEKNHAVGGTWHENKYPGCSCDVPVALYQFSFAGSLVWNKGYPVADEVEAYANELVERYQLAPHIRLGEPATKACWDAISRSWRVTTLAGGVLEAIAVVSALGQLNKPKWPKIEGIDTFQGPIMHTARWDRSQSWEGKLVGVIGTGASAVQLVPPMTETAEHLTVFQRSPNYILPRPDQEITPEDKALIMSDIEGALHVGALQRQLIFDTAELLTWKAFEWTEAGRTALTARARNHLEKTITDPDMRKALTPDFPIGCRRILICDDYYTALAQENTSLETTHIARLQPDGAKLSNGRFIPLDFIALATGFDTADWRWSLDVQGAEAQWLHDIWVDIPKAYLGITVANFPNFFMLYGPNTNLGHNSITSMMEAQMGHILGLLALVETHGAAAIVPKQSVQDAFNAQLQSDLKKTVWGDNTCGASWYKTEDGYITQNWSGTVTAYRAAVAEVKREDYDLIM